MRVLFRVLLVISVNLLMSVSVRAEVPLDMGGKTAMLAGLGLTGVDIYKVHVSKKRLAEAQSLLRSSQAYQEFVVAVGEAKTAENELAALAGSMADPNAVAAREAAEARLAAAKLKRDGLVGQVLDRDMLSFNPLKDGKPSPANIETDRAKVVSELEEAQGRLARVSKLRRLLGVGLFVGGSVVVFLTVTETELELVPSEAYNQLSPEQRDVVANEVYEAYYPEDQMSMEEILNEYYR